MFKEISNNIVIISIPINDEDMILKDTYDVIKKKNENNELYKLV